MTIDSIKKAKNISSWVVFTIALIVYFFSVERTGSLWDVGEFILGAYKLEVVHPPGAPLFMLIGSMFTFLAEVISDNPSDIAFAVNMMSGICTAIGAALVARITIVLGSLALVGRENNTDESQNLSLTFAGMAGGLASSVVIGGFEESIKLNLNLAFFMPLVMAMGGNAGVQSSSIIVQGLANNTIGSAGVVSKLGKEFLVALLNGLICSLLVLLYGIIFSIEQDITLVVSISLLSVILLASLMGTLVPLVLEKFEIDPALATGPFITTTNDLLGLFLYFLIGNTFLA